VGAKEVLTCKVVLFVDMKSALQRCEMTSNRKADQKFECVQKYAHADLIILYIPHLGLLLLL